MSELFLVRHAQASYGESDYDRLSELGHQQSRWLGEYFEYRKLRFDRVICGEMVRHGETLDNISAAMGKVIPNPAVHTQWNEFDFEALINAYLCKFPDQKPAENAPPEAFSCLLTNTLQAWADDVLARDIPESFAEFEQRVGAALSLATEQTERGGKVLVVSSGGPISMALKMVLMAPPGSMIRMNMQTRNSSYSRLFFNHESIHLAGFNHTPHLDHPGRGHALTYY